MNMPVKEVYDILRSPNSPLKDFNIFMFNVPQDFQKSNKLPIVRITEVNSYASGGASNRAFQLTSMVQVDIWTTDIQTLNSLYLSLINLMEEKGYFLNSGRCETDPDFNNIPRSWQRFRKTNQI